MLRMLHAAAPWALALGALLALPPGVAAQAAASETVELERRVEVPLRQGELDVAQLVRALLAEFDLAGEELPLPSARIDLRGTRGYLLLRGARALLGDVVRMQRDLDASVLVITIGRTRLRETRRDLRRSLAALVARLARADVDARHYELPLPPALDGQRPLVVLVHGLESDAAIWEDLRAYLARRAPRLQLTAFDYPNDESGERIAAELSQRLRALGAQPVALVGHSFGGLIARAVVENPALDPGNVRTLVQLGTPNRGSRLAGLRIALELRELLRDAAAAERPASGRALLGALLARWRDGLGEAGGDVWPGSVFLARLAQRSRNPRVTYHVVLGTRALLSERQVAPVRDALAAQLDDNTLSRVLAPRAEQWLRDLDELVDGRGDGAVSVARGQLSGVDAVLVPLDHLGLVRCRGLLGSLDADRHPVFAKVLECVAAVPAQQAVEGH